MNKVEAIEKVKCCDAPKVSSFEIGYDVSVDGEEHQFYCLNCKRLVFHMIPVDPEEEEYWSWSKTLTWE